MWLNSSGIPIYVREATPLGHTPLEFPSPERICLNSLAPIFLVCLTNSLKCNWNFIDLGKYGFNRGVGYFNNKDEFSIDFFHLDRGIDYRACILFDFINKILYFFSLDFYPGYLFYGTVFVFIYSNEDFATF